MSIAFPSCRPPSSWRQRVHRRPRSAVPDRGARSRGTARSAAGAFPAGGAGRHPLAVLR